MRAQLVLVALLILLGLWTSCHVRLCEPGPYFEEECQF